MARRLLITDHALDRFAERHPDFDQLEADESRQVLLSELDHGVPFGGQLGDDELYLLPCGYVAAISWRDGVGIVKTVLTRELAIANMQAQGVVLKETRQSNGPLARASRVEASYTDPLLASRMRRLAEQHLSEGIGRKRRNALLRELGYDPDGHIGGVYRAAFQAAREARWAADREAGND